MSEAPQRPTLKICDLERYEVIVREDFLDDGQWLLEEPPTDTSRGRLHVSPAIYAKLTQDQNR